VSIAVFDHLLDRVG